MAIKTIVIIKTINLRTNGDVTFDFELDVFNCGDAFQHEHSLILKSNLSIKAPTNTINSAIATFIREYTETNWGVKYDVLDNVKIFNPLNGLLA